MFQITFRNMHPYTRTNGTLQERAEPCETGFSKLPLGREKGAAQGKFIKVFKGLERIGVERRIGFNVLLDSCECITRFSDGEGLIGFQNSQPSPQRYSNTAMRCHADAGHHKPGGPLIYAETAMDLIDRHAVPAVEKHPDGREPLFSGIGLSSRWSPSSAKS